jgi:3-deoxy-D-manno-octulosonic-acid transferase
VIWLHCVSVGETNAARPLVDKLLEEFPDHRLIVSTITKSGQELAQKIFAEKADAVFYFPFDWKFTVRRALDRFKPSLILLMETELWPRFIHEGKQSGAKVAIVNGRLSERSAIRYSKIRVFISRVLKDLDRALMQTETDAKRLFSLGMSRENTVVTGNVKFDLDVESDDEVTRMLATRFAFSGGRPLIVAASTHEPEEKIVLEAFCSVAAEARPKPRLLIAPRHPERFDDVGDLIGKFRDNPACEWTGYSFARRAVEPSPRDANADVILLDSIGELRAIYPLAEIVFVGGSLIPHGGQSVLEPAAAGKAVITGPHTFNFESAVDELLSHEALVQLAPMREEQYGDELSEAFAELLRNAENRRRCGVKAKEVMIASRGATERTVRKLAQLVG